jgi:hypothetical protein
MRKFFVCLLTALLLCGVGTAFATQPLTTDSATTQGLKNAQVEVGFSYGEKDDLNVTEIPLTFTYGIANTIDLEASIPYARWEVNDFDEAGFSDLKIALKYNFYSGWAKLAIKPEVSIPTGDEDKGLGAGEFNYGTTFIATKQINDFTLHANVSYKKVDNDINVDTNDIWTGLIAAEYAIDEKLTAVAEVGLADYQDNLILTGGLVYNLAKGLYVDVAVGQTPNLDWKAQTGLTWRF